MWIGYPKCYHKTQARPMDRRFNWIRILNQRCNCMKPTTSNDIPCSPFKLLCLSLVVLLCLFIDLVFRLVSLTMRCCWNFIFYFLFFSPLFFFGSLLHNCLFVCLFQKEGIDQNQNQKRLPNVKDTKPKKDLPRKRQSAHETQNPNLCLSPKRTIN